MRVNAITTDSGRAPAKSLSQAKMKVPHWITHSPISSGIGIFLQRKSNCACGGGCPSCEKDSDGLKIQTKLAVSSPGDEFEQEADAVADQVMRMPDPVLQRQCKSCPDASAPSPNDEEEPQIKRKANGEGGAGEMASDFTSSLGAGMPLDRASRSYFEPRFGHDFGNVRIHDGLQAATAAARVQARAFTLGRDVVFAAGEHDPGSEGGKLLLAHELTHVVQQSGGGLRLARQPCPQLPSGGAAAAGGARHFVQLISGRYVGDLSGAQANVREDVLSVLTNLNRLWSISNTEYVAEQAQVSARPADARLVPGDIHRTITALQLNEEASINDQVANALLGTTLSAPVSELRANARVDIYQLQDALHVNWNINNHDYGVERARVNAGPDPVRNADIPATLRGLVCFKAGFAGGTSRRGGVLAGTGAPTTQQTADREAALITPGTQTTTTTVGGVTTTTRRGFRDVVSVGGVNRSYRNDLWHEMDAWVGPMFSRSQALLGRPRIGGGAPGNVSAFEPIGDAAKQAVDRAYGTYGQFGPRFHSGGNLLDASQRAGNAGVMIDYLVDNQEEIGIVRARHNADHSRGRPELAIARQFKLDYVAAGTNRHRLEVIDQAWPALNSAGTVSIQPFEGATPVATRRVRWDAFQTMIHEYFHSLNHPNYYRYARQLGGDSESVLVEGGASLMTDHAWIRISPTISTDASLRAAVEGHPAGFTPGVIQPIANTHYHPQFEQARDIETSFGQSNFQAAFLTGRMELIGYQQVAPATAAAAAGSQAYTVPPRGVRTLADVAYQTQTPVGQLATLNGLAVDAPVRPGQRIITRGMP